MTNPAKFDAIARQVLNVIRDRGDNGATERELEVYCQEYRTLDPSGRMAVMRALWRDGWVEQEMIKSALEPMKTWFAVSADDVTSL